jgi:hypothetical protein
MIVFNGINKRHFNRDAGFRKTRINKILQIITATIGPLIWFKADNPVRVSVETIDKELNGSMTLEIIVFKKSNYLFFYFFISFCLLFLSFHFLHISLFRWFRFISFPLR